MILNLKDLKPAEVQNYLQHAIAPRPICFACTMDAAGNINLSPFSFFNLFSSNPPVVVFSPAKSWRAGVFKSGRVCRRRHGACRGFAGNGGTLWHVHLARCRYCGGGRGADDGVPSAEQRLMPVASHAAQRRRIT